MHRSILPFALLFAALACLATPAAATRTPLKRLSYRSPAAPPPLVKRTDYTITSGLRKLGLKVQKDASRLDGRCSDICDAWLLTLDYCAGSMLASRVAPCLCSSMALERMETCARCLGTEGVEDYDAFTAYCGLDAWQQQEEDESSEGRDSVWRV